DRECDRFTGFAINLRYESRRGPRPAVPEDEGRSASDTCLPQPRPLAEGPERPGSALLALGQAEDPLLRVETRVRLGASLSRLGEDRPRERLRLEFRDHLVGHRAGVGLQPRPPIALDG